MRKEDHKYKENKEEIVVKRRNLWLKKKAMKIKTRERMRNGK